MSDLLTTENLVAFVTLTVLEVVLGIDNIVFIAILSGKLEVSLQPKARRVGLAAAMIMRIGMLLGISWILHLEQTVLTVAGHALTWKHLVLLAGGLFLLGKATHEIHGKLEMPSQEVGRAKAATTFAAVVLQIMILDVVFSIDSVVTAVGMAEHIEVMIAAVVVSVVVMMIFANPVCGFIERHPTMKMLALSFLLLIGMMLVAEGLGTHISRGYIYFAMAFSLAVEMLNIRFRRVRGARRSAPENGMMQG